MFDGVRFFFHDGLDRLLIFYKMASRRPSDNQNRDLFFWSDEDDDIDQFRQLEEALQQDSSSDSELFLNPKRLKKKFPTLFADTEMTSKQDIESNHESDSQSDNSEQIAKLTNDLHEAFRLITQRKAELERMQKKFMKEKKQFAKEKARYESEMIFADAESTNNTSYLILKQKYSDLKEKYRNEKTEWKIEKNDYIKQIEILNQQLKEQSALLEKSQVKSRIMHNLSSDSANDEVDAFPRHTSKSPKTLSTPPQTKSNVLTNSSLHVDHVSPQSQSPTINSSEMKMKIMDKFLEEEISDDMIISNDGVNDLEELNNSNYLLQNDQYLSIKKEEPSPIKPKSEIIDIKPNISAQITDFSSPKPNIRNWADFEESSDASIEEVIVSPKKPDQPLVIRANIPKGNSSSSSYINNTDYSSSSIKAKSQKASKKQPPPSNKISPKSNNNIYSSPPSNKSTDSKLNSKQNIPSKNKASQINYNSESSQSSFVEIRQDTVQRAKPSTALKNIQAKQKSSCSIYDNYDVDFDINLGEIIDQKSAPNGTKTIKYFDGSTETQFANGTRKITRSNCIYVCYPNGDISQEFTDSAKAYKYANGTIDLTLPNGVIIYVFTNGQREKHYLNGDKEIYYPTGETKYIKVGA